MMKAIVIRQYGGREVLELADIPKPVISESEILVRIMAAGVNPVDWKIREGLLAQRMPSELPIIPGWDMAGIVEEVGSQITTYKKGDEVFGYCRKEKIHDGTYTSWIALKEAHLAFKPQNLSFEEAATIPLAGLTAYQCLFESLQLKPSETILIHAGAGGVGGFAIQLAKWKGAYVMTTASSRHHDYVTQLGADWVINYQEKDFVKVIQKKYPMGVDAVFDTVGGDTQKRSADVLKKGGRLTSILALNEDYFKTKNILTGYVFVRPEPTQLDKLRHLAEALQLKTHIEAVYPLKEAPLAHKHIEAGHTQGKIVLKI